jgi:hypothetical protein
MHSEGGRGSTRPRGARGDRDCITCAALAADRPGPVHLTVSDLERSLSFYRASVERDARTLLVLTEELETLRERWPHAPEQLP